MLERIRTAVAQQPVIVALDRLDDSWDGSLDSQSLLIGLLKAAKSLNDRFGASGGIRVVTFLRSDIYEVLRFDDKDKHRATERWITWTPELLRDMLGKRLPEGVSVEELFELGEMRGSIEPFNYIVKRTFLRPREILQFIEACIAAAGSSATEISKDAVRDAEARYSAWKVEDIKQEFGRALPRFDSLLESLRQELHRYENSDELVQLIHRKASDALAELGPRRCLEVLFDSSVIGVRLGDSGSPRFKSEDSSLTLPTSGAIYVHQSLYRGLNITEARRDRGASSGTGHVAEEYEPLDTDDS